MVELEGDRLRVTGPQLDAESVSISDLIWLESRSDAEVYGKRNVDGWRLGLALPLPAAIADILPKARRFGGIIDRLGLWPAVGAFAALSASALYLTVRIPDIVVPLIPTSWERKFGEALIGELGNRICNDAAGQAALDAMVRRLSPQKTPPKVQIANFPQVNAVTFPGGTIILFQGLIQQAASPDEVAGVIAHELGHVENRDIVHALVRQLGLSIVTQGFGGGAGNMLNTLFSASYSQKAEAKADVYARDALRRARISPLPTADFFKGLTLGSASETAGLIAYVASHPAPQSRDDFFRQDWVKGQRYPPAVSGAEWRAIQQSCSRDGKDSSDSGLF